MNTQGHPLDADRTPRPPRLYRVMTAIMAPVEGLLRFNCRHFMRLASERCDRPLSTSETLFYHAHRWMCGICRRQEKRLQQVRALVNSSTHASMDDGTVHLAEDARAHLQRRLAQELAGGAADNPPQA